MIELLIWLTICVFAVWQTVEILHHSKAGAIWRIIANWLSDNSWTKLNSWTRWLGDGMSCPFCYSNWWGMLYVGAFAFASFDWIMASVISFVGGLAVARLANLINDYFHNICRTPNLNDLSKSSQVQAYQDQHNPIPYEQI